jgi:adenylate kinase family enzyme
VSTLVYVHGTNGSGKSTLARAVIEAAGGVSGVNTVIRRNKTTWTHKHVALLGKYGNACGGLDGVHPYSDTHTLMQYARFLSASGVFAEGLVTPGLQTCMDFAAYFDRAVFILLDTPETVCITNVLNRRTAAGNTKPYSADNLYRKAKSACNWANRLERAGLEVKRLQYDQALAETLSALNLGVSK